MEASPSGRLLLNNYIPANSDTGQQDFKQPITAHSY